jgi:DMSO/TMAO reductase YedYZ molybdopterin-dependent catalytic subunit
VLPSLVAGVVGIGALAWLVRAEHPTAATASGPSRRGVLVAAGALAVGGVAMAGAGRWITSYRTRAIDIALPAPGRPGAGVPDRSGRPGSRASPRCAPRRPVLPRRHPALAAGRRRRRLDADHRRDVDREVTFTLDDLLAMPLIERDITLTCVSNEVGGKYVGGARWLGVRLTDLLSQAGISHTRADQILSTDVDGMTISTPLAVATDGRDAMIAVGMNGRSLPRDHGFPARMVVPGLYGFVSACKWITRMTLTTYAEETAYWTERDWATDAPIKIASRVDTPRGLSTVEPGRTVIGGIAWAQHQGGIGAVEVRVDDGEWQRARLGPPAGQDYWRQWYLPWTAETGQHSLAVRAVTGETRPRPPRGRTPFPNGSSGIQEVVVTVR